jgi:hypothetical protein
MIVMINGSFGVGKTTVARLLREATNGSRIYDPEWAGIALMRLPTWIKINGSGTDDFQDIALWRRSVPTGIKLVRLLAKGPVIVPMTFSNKAYFDEVMTGVRRLDPASRVFCLKASLAIVRSRLVNRGERLDAPGSEWMVRRISECEQAHRGSDFGEPVETEDRTAKQVAEDILNRLRQTATP